jgi:hypothetical protein
MGSFYYKRRRKAVKKKPTKKLFVGDLLTTVRMAAAKAREWDTKYLSELFGIDLVGMDSDQEKPLIKKRAKGIAAYLQKYLDK